jgi:ParB-like nuclease family protein
MCDRVSQLSITSMLMTGSTTMDAELAFGRAKRRRHGALRVYEQPRRPALLPGRREIPLDEIAGTTEPSRARQFDRCFKPTRAVRERWQRLWAAEHRGIVLPPISVVPVGDGYAILDGHHRVSVAKARGAATIDAVIDAA